MVISGTAILERKKPFYLELKKPLNVFQRPELYVSKPNTAIYLEAFLCTGKATKYETGEVLLLTERRINLLDWGKLRLNEYSPKFIDGIVLIQSMALKVEVRYELILKINYF